MAVETSRLVDQIMKSLPTFFYLESECKQYTIQDVAQSGISSASDENVVSCTPDEKLQVNPRFWPGLEILF